jgi:serine/threonine protein kinase
MIVDSQAFLDQARSHGILSAVQLAAVSKRFAPQAPFHELAGALVDQGWLTPYQVERICAGEGKGLVLGQYRILQELGRGGFGCVFKAMHLIMNRVVALKVISPEMVNDGRARAWFRREVLATTQFQHPNIAMAFDANEVDDVLFLVTEYVDGQNLADVVTKQGPLPVGLACALMLQAARALQYADEKGMVHRDIKPANLLLPRTVVPEKDNGASGAFPSVNQVLVKIVDFGLARLQSQASPNTLVGLKEKGFAGTPDYVSPEQARNIHDVDIRSDLYSLGCTFFFALTGRPPFTGKNPLEIVLQHLEQEPPGLSKFRPEMPPALVSIVRRLMAKRPEQRFQTPGDLADELSFFFGAGALAAPVPLHRPDPGPARDKKDSIAPRAVNVPTPVARRPDSVNPAPAETAEGRDLPQTRIVAEGLMPRSDPAPMAEPSAAAPKSAAVSRAPTPPYATSVVSQALTVDWAAEEPIFAERWQEWIGVVDDLVQGRAPSLGGPGYAVLHSELLRATQRQAECSQAPAHHKAVQTLLEPWLSLHSLAQTDRQTLASLLGRCKQLEHDMNLKRPSHRLGAWVLVALLFVVSVTVGLFVLYGAGSSGQWHWEFSSLGPWVKAHPLLALVLVVPPCVLGSVYFFTRLPRT